jgi:hypothetical protein
LKSWLNGGCEYQVSGRTGQCHCQQTEHHTPEPEPDCRTCKGQWKGGGVIGERSTKAVMVRAYILHMCLCVCMCCTPLVGEVVELGSALVVELNTTLKGKAAGRVRSSEVVARGLRMHCW